MKGKSVLLGIGECNIDLFAHVEDSFIDKHASGHRGGDFYCNSETFDRILAEIGEPEKIVPGGSSANTIRTLARLGEACAFVGAVGSDQWGDVFTKNLIQLGVDPRLKQSPFTFRVLCLISHDGQRTFIVEDSPDKGMSVPSVELEDVKWVHIEARTLNGDRDAVERIFANARQKKIPISLDLSSFETVETYKTVLKPLIGSAQIVFCNEDEIRALTGHGGEEGCYCLQEMCPIGIVTLGEKGCLFGSENFVEAVAAFPAKAIDTTGAGDYFAAGFLYGYLQNRSLKECALLGNRLGSAIVQVIGVELPDPANFLE